MLIVRTLFGGRGLPDAGLMSKNINLDFKEKVLFIFTSKDGQRHGWGLIIFIQRQTPSHGVTIDNTPLGHMSALSPPW